MHNTNDLLGQIILLNGTPRSGKSSIAAEIQATFPGVWINLGVDVYMKAIPKQFQPGIGLRPGGERPDMEPMIQNLYYALYQSIAAHSRAGINVVADVGHHDFYATIHGILPMCAKVLQGLPAVFVGVHCPIDEIMRRRIATWNAGYEADGSIPAPVLRWQTAVHTHGIYDVEVDTSKISPQECVQQIAQYLACNTPTALARLSQIE